MIARVRGPIRAAIWSRIQAPGLRIAVDEHGHGTRVQHRDDARDDRERRQDHLVSRLEPECGDRGFERRGAVADGDPVPASAIGRPALLELGDVAARRGHPARRHTFVDQLTLRSPSERLVDGDHPRRRAGGCRAAGSTRAQGQNRSFSSRPVYGPCLTSRNVVSSSIRKPWPPAKMTTTSPAASSRVVTSVRSSS